MDPFCAVSAKGTYLDYLPEELIDLLFQFARGNGKLLITLGDRYVKIFKKFVIKLKAGFIDPDVAFNEDYINLDFKYPIDYFFRDSGNWGYHPPIFIDGGLDKIYPAIRWRIFTPTSIKGYNYMMMARYKSTGCILFEASCHEYKTETTKI